MTAPLVQVVHCVDTEGPLHESLEATFERLGQIFGRDLEPTQENLEALRRGDLDLGEHTEAARRAVAPRLLDCLGDWEAVEAMVGKVTDPAFRAVLPDSTGGGWVYSWFCLDHVGYTANPRRRDLGHHRIFDRYRRLLAQPANARDGLHFHYHPLPFNRMAHACATRFLHADHLVEILARRLIDRAWFPAVFRPGFHAERPDGHAFLEQWLPFDFGNQASAGDTDQPDLAGGRFGDWRRAPRAWGAYHPSHDDYQVPGECRRWIFRCLNLGARVRPLQPEDVEEAFAQAERTGSAVLAFTDHDFRDMAPGVTAARAMLQRASRAYPTVAFRYTEALEAARSHLGLTPRPSGLEVRLERGPRGDRLAVGSDRPLFGPQPFLALKDRDGGYHHDNFDFSVDPRRWHYTFDWQTFPLEALACVAVAATGPEGTVDLARLDPATGAVETTCLNLPEGAP